MTEASAEFRDVWSKHDVRLPATGTHRFHHRRVGVLELVVVSAVLRADPALTLLLATAEPGSASETALRQLAAANAAGPNSRGASASAPTTPATCSSSSNAAPPPPTLALLATGAT